MASGTENYVKSRLRLRAITLRGVGPYIEGSRQEIRPLTVLCGTNGSGKSTWLRMLDLLKENADQLPWGFAARDEDASAIAFTNAFYHLQPDTHTFRPASDKDQLKSFGPTGTVGLEFDVVESFSLPGPDKHGFEGGFLLSGRCEKGDRLKLRFGDPSYWTASEHNRALREYAELSWNDCSVRWDCPLGFSAENPLSPHAYPGNSETPLAASNLHCSPALFTGRADAIDPVWMATFRRTTDVTVESHSKDIDGAGVEIVIELASSHNETAYDGVARWLSPYWRNPPGRGYSAS